MAVYPTHGLTFKIGKAGDTSASLVVKDVTSIEPKLKGQVKTWNPLDQHGWQRALMTGKGLTIAHKGQRNEGDPGNDLIAGMLMAIGSACTIPYEIDFPSGSKLNGNVVIDLSTPFGGAATDLSSLEWDAVMDGEPTWTAAS
ncbi:MAG: hypothetical protein ABF449_05750 [Ethanoligenens sp.]|uniref:phage tail tube protein n=1 Tax=Ethanoligenens sp. TaxID=2099655 RepID=UPI0039E7A1E2